MGLFLSMSGVIGTSLGDVRKALEDFASANSGGCELSTGTLGDGNVGFLTCVGANATILYPDGFCEWDDASRFLSKTLGRPVFSLHIHDGDLWMFLLFRDGQEIGRFNPWPDYWEKLEPAERARWKGDALLIAQSLPGLAPETVEKYFVEWTDEIAGNPEGPRFAYPDDEYPYGDCWQVTEFMRKVGLTYTTGAPGEVQGDTFRLWTKKFHWKRPPKSAAKRPMSATPLRRPWWRFW